MTAFRGLGAGLLIVGISVLGWQYMLGCVSGIIFMYVAESLRYY